jgi:hypothetical protein
MNNISRSAEDIPRVLAAQSGLITDDLLSWQFRKPVADALSHTRSSVVGEAGGPREYLIGRDGFSEGEVKQFKGFVAEQFRNRIEPGSVMEADPRHPYIDRIHNGITIQDYAGKDLFQFAEKIESDTQADIFRITQQMHDKVIAYLENNPMGKLAPIFQENLDKLSPDNMIGGQITSAELYEKYSEAGSERLMNPVENLFKDIGQAEALGLAIFTINTFAADVVSRGIVDEKTWSKIIYRAPSFLLRYTVIGGLSVSATQIISQYSNIVSQNSDSFIPGIGFILLAGWNTFRWIKSDISQQQFIKTTTYSAVGTALALGSKLSIGYYFDPSLGVLTTCVIGVSVAYSATLGYVVSRKQERYRIGRINKLLGVLNDDLQHKTNHTQTIATTTHTQL